MLTQSEVYVFISFKSDFQGSVVFEAFNRTVVTRLVSITDFPRSEHVIDGQYSVMSRNGSFKI